MITMVNIFLTRKCNLKCSYCGIGVNIDHCDKPPEYPDAAYYYGNEKPYTYWIDVIKGVLNKNKDAFFLLYGGEPFLYGDIEELLVEMNNLNCGYTIISNSHTQDKIINVANAVIEKTGKRLTGYTASVDPGFWVGLDGRDEVKKSKDGFDLLTKLILLDLVSDPVAEITVTDRNKQYLTETVNRLSHHGIYSSITVLDKRKNRYYDFSSVVSDEQLVRKDGYIYEIFDRLKRSDLLIHMKHVLLDKLYSILPCDNDCVLDHDMSFDSDGSTRLCLRIKGIAVQNYDWTIFLDDELFERYKKSIQLDKSRLCERCSWTGPLMSSECDPKSIHMH